MVGDIYGSYVVELFFCFWWLIVVCGRYYVRGDLRSLFYCSEGLVVSVHLVGEIVFGGCGPVQFKVFGWVLDCS